MPTQESLKNILRKNYLQKRVSTSKKGTENASIFKLLQHFLVRYQNKNTAEEITSETLIIALYVPIEQEVDMLCFAEKLEKDYLLCLPKTIDKNTALVFNLYRSTETLLKKDSFGILTACGKEITPDIIIVPLVAFCRNGHRIGYGAGMYDRTFESYEKLGKKVLKIGVAYAFQECEAFETNKHDIQLDYVVTEKEIIECR